MKSYLTAIEVRGVIVQAKQSGRRNKPTLMPLPVFSEPRVVGARRRQREDDLVPAGAPPQDGDERRGQGLNPLRVGRVQGPGGGLE